jgi:polyisoprenoid-binding protein YceI
MPVNLVGIGQGPFGERRAGFFTKFTIKRSDFGMDKMQGQIGDNISVTFSFEGVKK